MMDVARFTLSLRIQCPVCSANFYAGLMNWGGNMFPCCQGKRCRARFWVMELIPPNPRDHLQRVLKDGAKGILESVEIPDSSTDPIYLHILVSPREQHEMRRSGLLSFLRRNAA